MTGSTVSGDSAANGGGVGDSEGFVTLTNDTIVKDSAGTGDGGGVLVGGNTTLLDDTLSADTATTGPGIYVGNTVKLTATILDQAACHIVGGATVTDGGYNDESDNTCRLGASTNRLTNASIDLASTLAANGSTGPQTLAITTASSAVDYVLSSLCTLNPVDERGVSRPGISGQTSCDVGAYELHVTVSKPSAPRSPHAKGGKKSITLSWKAPSSTGGLAISAYHAYCSLKKKVSTAGGGSATTGKHHSVTVKKLKAKETYYCVVVAANSKGRSPASKPVHAKTKK